MSQKTIVTTVLVALGAGLLGGVGAPPAEAWSGTLQYACGGPGFGSAPPYAFAAVLDTDVPATLPYGSQRTTAWATHLFVPEAFRSWAYSMGYRRVSAGAFVDVAVDGAAQPQMYHAAPGVDVPATPQTWTWDATSTTTVSASSLGHHAVSITGLTVTVAFQDAGGNNVLATSASCVLDPATPMTDTVVDGYDVVTATTTTTLAVAGDTASATVTSNGTPPVGIVTFSVAGKPVAMDVVGGKATAKLPAVPPGDYDVSALFVPSQATQLTGSAATVSYTVEPFVTKTRAFATYRPAREILKARARLTASDGSVVSGRVTFVLKRNGTALDNVTVRLSDQGAAVKKFRGITKAGRYVVLARYLGSGTYQPSKDSERLSLP